MGQVKPKPIADRQVVHVVRRGVLESLPLWPGTLRRAQSDPVHVCLAMAKYRSCRQATKSSRSVVIMRPRYLVRGLGYLPASSVCCAWQWPACLGSLPG